MVYFTQLRGIYVLCETEAERKVYLTANNAHAVQTAQLPSTQKNYSSKERQKKKQSKTTLGDHVVLRMQLGMWSHVTSAPSALLVRCAVSRSYVVPFVTWEPEPILNI